VGVEFVKNTRICHFQGLK